MSALLLHPTLVLTLGALLALLLPQGRWRKGLLVGLPLVVLALLELALERGGGPTLRLLGHDLQPLRLDALSAAFARVFLLVLSLGNLFAWTQEDPREQVAATAYGGAAVGAVLAGDLLSLFVCWELTAVTSAVLVFAPGAQRNRAAGMRYLGFQVVSGLLVLAGALLRLHDGHGLAFDALGLDAAWGWLLLLGFGIKCAFPGLHTWLVDAYPEGSPSGTVFLSVFTSKMAVYALARGFEAEPVLVPIGVVMAAFPIFFAEIEDDMRRVLSYSLVNQVGFMVVGIGIGGPLAFAGAVSNAVAHVLFKGLLFMSMGAVLFRTGKRGASELGGLHRTMPFTTVCCLVGAASISAFPLFSAFCTKSLIMEGAAVGGWQVTWLVLLFAAAGVLHHAGIKIPFFAFFAHDSGLRPAEAPWSMRLAMGGAAALCVLFGCFPALLYGFAAVETDYQPYTTSHVVTQLQLLVCSALALALLMRLGRYPPEVAGVNLDVDAPFRWLGRGAWALLTGPVARAARLVEDLLLVGIPAAVAGAITRRGRLGAELAARWAYGGSVLAIVVLLLVLLLLDLGRA